MVIAIEETRLVYAAVPKAGCTTVKLMLAQVDGARDPGETEGLPQSQVHKFYPTGPFRRRVWRKFSNGFRFSVIRNPVERLLSVFTDRVLEKKDLYISPRIRSGRPGLPRDPDPDFFFQNLDQYRAASSSIRHHTHPTRRFTGNVLDRFDRIYTTGELPGLAQDLSEFTGQTVHLPHASRSKTKLKLDDDLRPETRQAIAAYLDDEYRFLSNRFNNPFA